MFQVVVFIDGGYLKKIIHDLSTEKIDYHKLVRWTCNGDERLLRSYYYGCPPYQSPKPTKDEMERLSKADKFFTALEGGERFTVRRGRLEKRDKNQGTGVFYVQKQVDLQLGIDIARFVVRRQVDTIVIIAGDSDFIPAVEFAKLEGVIVRLVHGPFETCHRKLWLAVDERKEITKNVLKRMHLE